MGLFSMGDLPLGLPEGSVRAIIALGLTALVGYSYVSTGLIDATLLAFAGPYIGYYFADRQSTSAATAAAAVVAKAAEPEVVSPPYIPGPDEDL